MLCSLLVLSLRGVQLPSAERPSLRLSRCNLCWFRGIACFRGMWNERETDEAGSKPLSQTEIRIISAWGLLLAALSAASLASCLFGAS